MLLLLSSLVLAAFAALFQSQPGKDGAPAQRVFLVNLKALGEGLGHLPALAWVESHTAAPPRPGLAAVLCVSVCHSC